MSTVGFKSGAGISGLLGGKQGLNCLPNGSADLLAGGCGIDLLHAAWFRLSQYLKAAFHALEELPASALNAVAHRGCASFPGLTAGFANAQRHMEQQGEVGAGVAYGKIDNGAHLGYFEATA